MNILKIVNYTLQCLSHFNYHAHTYVVAYCCCFQSSFLCTIFGKRWYYNVFKTFYHAVRENRTARVFCFNWLSRVNACESLRSCLSFACFIFFIRDTINYFRKRMLGCCSVSFLINLF